MNHVTWWTLRPRYKSPMFQCGPDGKPSFLHRECPQETFPISFRSPSSITVKGPPESPMQDVAPSTTAHCCRDVKFCKTQVFRHSSIVMHCTLSNYEFTIMIRIKFTWISVHCKVEAIIPGRVSPPPKCFSSFKTYIQAHSRYDSFCFQRK